jgi:hypothetical protein
MRNRKGQFAKGNSGGPGRPKRVDQTPPIPSTPAIGDDAELLIERNARADIERAWRHLLDTMPIRDVQVLAASARSRWKWIPDWPELQSPPE